MLNGHQDEVPIGPIGPAPERDLEQAGAATAREYLADVISRAKTHGGWPAVTLATLQPGVDAGGNWPNFQPAVCGYSWGLRPQNIDDEAGNTIGIGFGTRTWYSNDVATGSFWDMQQFAAQGTLPGRTTPS